MIRLKKYLTIFIIFLFIGAHVLAPFAVLAQEVTPTDTPTPTVDQQVTPTDTPTPSTDPSTATPTPTTDITIDNSGTTTNNTNNNADSGNNAINPSVTPDPIATDSATPTPDTSGSSYSQNNNNSQGSNGNAGVKTGDAVAVTTGENDANTTSVNSQVVNQTINIFVNQQGDIDLSTPFNIAYSIIAHDKNTSPTVNVALTSINNYTYLANDIVSSANTGDNTIDGAHNALIKTGDAYSIVSFLNKANFTIVDSTVHIVTINIFGDFSGNIILPDLASTSGCTSCGVSVDTHNTATVNNEVDSSAVSGQNTITTNGNAQINTGDTHSIINVLNMVNTDAIGVSFQQLFISIFGSWTGNFLGWAGADTTAGGQSMGVTSIGNNSAPGTDCGCDTNLETTSEAVVTNHVLSSANSGGNKIYGGNAEISTGNAFSAVSLINFINSNFFRSTGFFGFINVFGNWKGDIGGASKFVATQVTSADNAQDQQPDQQDAKKESGGLLTVVNTNNVGAYVHPGDTVTFFIDVTNPGTGKVYNAKVNLDLIHNGKDMGGGIFNLGNIPAGKTLHLKTGIVLGSKSANGSYIAQAAVSGTTGEDNTTVEANASSNFLVFGEQNAVLSANTHNTQGGNNQVIAVKGASTTKGTGGNDNLFIFLSLLSLSAFLTIRGIKRWRFIKALFVKSAPFYTRLALLRSFLL